MLPYSFPEQVSQKSMITEQLRGNFDKVRFHNLSASRLSYIYTYVVGNFVPGDLTEKVGKGPQEDGPDEKVSSEKFEQA